MRNINILTKFTGQFDKVGADDTVASACLDEFGHLIFVYTLNHHLYVYKYNPERPSVGL